LTYAAGAGNGRQEPSDTELHENTIRISQLDTRTAIPGKVLSFDAAKRTAKVEIQIQAVDVNPDTNEQTIADPVILQGIPVVQSFQNGGYLSFPLTVGDTGIVLTMDRDISNWKELGRPTRPRTFFLHNQASSVFIPGLLPNTKAQENPIEQAAAVFEAELIKLGKDASDEFVALGNSLLNFINSFISTYNSHTHILSGSADLATGTVTGSAVPTTDTQSAGNPATLLSSKVMVE
jgi:hypothetical protein